MIREDEKCKKVTEQVTKQANKTLLEAADLETKKIVTELSNHSFLKAMFLV